MPVGLLPWQVAPTVRSFL